MAKSNAENSVSVLVVCLGNICRSPMGEAVLREVAKSRGHDIEVDSCGTGAYHCGEDPDERTVATCRKAGLCLHPFRPLEREDFDKFTHILAADTNNLRNLQSIAPKNSSAEVRLWGSYLDDKPIPDPYYGSSGGFERVYEQCVRLSNAFLDDVFGKPKPTSGL
ncbi:phosphotyrosine protein phosphatase [Cylindrobasidium torrendii FP15055 ss-10]|uniref:Phosphotyrosine protein phosphatase n=1 Tax=Cylindrobasidium torrendii FP15055 ss-10 TaxID=1314674 RepID=A0A0D7BI38_9AGAR|nr:phosphotyrosine protein phosphatase [Cylindrobasidium torrendii FP15055 ss-10]